MCFPVKYLGLQQLSYLMFYFKALFWSTWYIVIFLWWSGNLVWFGLKGIYSEEEISPESPALGKRMWLLGYCWKTYTGPWRGGYSKMGLSWGSLPTGGFCKIGIFLATYHRKTYEGGECLMTWQGGLEKEDWRQSWHWACGTICPNHLSAEHGTVRAVPQLSSATAPGKLLLFKQALFLNNMASTKAF